MLLGLCHYVEIQLLSGIFSFSAVKSCGIVTYPEVCNPKTESYRLLLVPG